MSNASVINPCGERFETVADDGFVAEERVFYMGCVGDC